jgi:broad specificity phosphatase PhoE
VSEPPQRQNEIWVARHGATEWAQSGRHTGRTDVALTAEGRKQAAALVRPLDAHRFALVLTSPLVRARDTARIAGFAGAEVDPDLLEWDYGEYEGLTTTEIQAHRPGWNLWRDGVLGGEPIDDVGARAQRVIARADAAPGDALLFAHGHVLRILTAVALELGPRAGARFALRTARLGVIGWEHDYRSLTAW